MKKVHFRIDIHGVMKQWIFNNSEFYHQTYKIIKDHFEKLIILTYTYVLDWPHFCQNACRMMHTCIYVYFLLKTPVTVLKFTIYNAKFKQEVPIIWHAFWRKWLFWRHPGTFCKMTYISKTTRLNKKCRTAFQSWQNLCSIAVYNLRDIY